MSSACRAVRVFGLYVPRSVAVRALGCAAALGLLAGCVRTPTHYVDRPIAYPQPRMQAQTDDYHGVQVADPYRWMEDLDGAETKAWVDAENKVTYDYLAEIPCRSRIKDRLTRMWNYERFGLPEREGQRYFISRNNGLQNQGVIYTMDSLDGTMHELLDPNALSKDGTIALSGMSASDDGNLMAYGLSSGGSDWQEWRVRDVRTGKDLPDLIQWVKFSGASWAKDGSGFYYSRFDAPKPGEEREQTNYFQKLYFHKLGTPQSQDVLVYHRPDQKEWEFSGGVTDDGAYLVISISQGTERKNRVYLQELKNGTASVTPMLDAFDAEYDYVGNDGSLFYFRTDNGAPRGRLIAVDSRNASESNWKELVPQNSETLRGVSLVGNQFFCSYMKDACTQVRVVDTRGAAVREVALPGLGTAGGFGGHRVDTETFYSYTSFNQPTTIYRHDLATGQSTIFRQPKVRCSPDDYEVKQVFYTSKDGTRIPMFVAHRKGLALDGNTPTLLYGYGGFNAALTPTFSIPNLVWMDMGGVYAMPNLRGGGEYGKEWHEAGRKLHKQNVFDDFIAAAEWLIANKYTRSEKLAISGASNGGLLIGACMTQRPELFGAALPAVGVLDMLRFQKHTIGWAWVSDYGCSDNPEEFRCLYAYSPLHNLKPGTKYPATLITTGDHDDRVVPSHSFKFAAALQRVHASPTTPTLIRIETRAGHGAGKPTAKIIEEQADKLAFLARVLGMDDSKI